MCQLPLIFSGYSKTFLNVFICPNLNNFFCAILNSKIAYLNKCNNGGACFAVALPKMKKPLLHYEVKAIEKTRSCRGRVRTSTRQLAFEQKKKKSLNFFELVVDPSRYTCRYNGITQCLSCYPHPRDKGACLPNNFITPQC